MLHVDPSLQAKGADYTLYPWKISCVICCT